MAVGLPIYPAFDDKEGPSLASDWEDWIEGIDSLLNAMAITDDKEKFVKLYHYLGQTRKILKKLEKNGIDGQDYKAAKEALCKHFNPQRNSIYLLNQLYHMEQDSGESMDHFYMRVKEQMQKLNLEKKSVTQIEELLTLAQLVNSTNDSTLRTKALRDTNLKLKNFLDNARAHEMANQQSSEIGGTRSTSDSMAVRRKFVPSKSQKFEPEYCQSSTKNSQQSTCNYCGGSDHPRTLCRARNMVCFKCKIKGHLAVVCQQKQSSVNEVASSNSEDVPFDMSFQPYSEPFVGAVDTDIGVVSKKIVQISINGITIPLRIDTGAEATLIDTKLYKRHFASVTLKPSSCVFRGAQQGKFKAQGYFRATLKFQDRTHFEDIYVIEDASHLLSCTASTALGLVKFTCSVYAEQFPSLFTGLGKMLHPYDIKLREDTEPYAVHTPRRVAHPVLPKLEAELKRLQDLDVISPVTKPTEWCAPIVVVPKANGKDVRLCVDLTKLNKAVLRPRHILPSVDYVLGQIGNAKVFSKLDANSGFHQVVLTENSKLLTTFITPFGRFAYNRLPFGITSAPEFYQQQVSQILAGLPGTVCLMDDIMIAGRDETEHDERLKATLSRLVSAGITLNKEKCVFKKPSISFLGHVVSGDGIKADPRKVAAIKGMDTPSDISDLRRFLGMVNQLGKFTADIATLTQPLRELLSSRNAWYWGPAQEDAVLKIKELLTNTPILALYNPDARTKVSADASSFGLGAVLLQQKDSKWHPIAYASRALSATEQRYAQLEKEALALTWACERFRDYLIGTQFLIETDHKPLVPLLGTKDLDQLPARVQRFRMRLMWFNYDIVHVPGKELYTADTLSRAPCNGPSDADVAFQEETTAFVNFVQSSLPASDQRLSQIKEHQWVDDVCREVIMYVQEGWPDKSQVKGIAKKYLPYQPELSLLDNLLVMGNRIVIPSSLRPDILNKLHEGHQGITKCSQMARDSVWWPGIGSDIEELIGKCHYCKKKNSNYKEPLVPSPIPEQAWYKVATDLFQLGKDNYIVLVDFYSRYPEFAKLESTTSSTIITHMKSIFARHGIPRVVCSDNGPQYSCREFADFARDYGFSHVTSSPGHPSGNGEAERAVRTVKELVKQADPYIALLNYRNTPIHNGFSPAELLMNRKLNTKLPMLPSNLNPSPPDMDRVKEREEDYRCKTKLNFDRRHNSRHLTDLNSGDDVWLRDRNEVGTVRDKLHERAYEVATPKGTYVRNRIQLSELPSEKQAAPSAEICVPTPPKPVDSEPDKGPALPVTTKSGREIKIPSRYKE